VVYPVAMDRPDDKAVESELRAAQAAVISAREARLRRQAAVLAARGAGWSKYRIADVLGVKAPTVDSILKAAAVSDDVR
jgi:DNA-directed RNA polymerase specialized sigma24 family protein